MPQKMLEAWPRSDRVLALLLLRLVPRVSDCKDLNGADGGHEVLVGHGGEVLSGDALLVGALADRVQHCSCSNRDRFRILAAREHSKQSWKNQPFWPKSFVSWRRLADSSNASCVRLVFWHGGEAFGDVLGVEFTTTESPAE